MTAKKCYRVRTDTNYKTSDHLQHGYEKESDYRRALCILQNRFMGRVGECVDERNNFMLLRFTDTPDGAKEERWFPYFLLIEAPSSSLSTRRIPKNNILDSAFEFE